MSIFTVADEIWFDGYRIAIMTTDVPATVMAEFEDGLNGKSLFGADGTLGVDQNLSECEFRDQITDEAMQAAYDMAKSVVRGGLLSLKDLARVMDEQGTEVK